ncbi:MAG: class I SAM-dependent methyltransferase [Desulfobacterales bacterium]|nr:class I SAM-dependent methyltransferase [Desulfobacterales bacterium]
MNSDDVWEKIFQNQEWGKYPAEVLIRFIAKNFYHTDRGTIRILEVGCGPGPNVWYFAREGFKAYGIDISPTAIENARKRIKEDGLSAELAVGNIEKLPYSDAFFDCVVDNECLYCNPLKKAEYILKEVKRVLKKGGTLFSRTFTDEMYVGRSHKRISEFEYDDVSDGPFANSGFARLIRRDGITKLYGSFFKIASIDKLECTHNNSEAKLSEWIIICHN